MNRKDLLAEAARLTCGDRNAEYGEPYDNLGDCAVLWTAYIFAKYAGDVIDPASFNLTAEDVAHLNVLQKMARTFRGKPKPDTYADGAAYFAIAGECASKEIR